MIASGIIRVALFATFLSLVLPVSSVAANSAGTPCAQQGALSGTARQPLVCRRVKGKLVWRNSGSSVVASVKSPPSRLSIPLKAQFSQDLGISLVWGPPIDAAVSKPTAYRAEFRTASTPWLTLQDWPITNSALPTYTQTIKGEKLIGMTLRFRIAAVNASGAGEFSESDWVTYSATSGLSPGSAGSGSSSGSVDIIPRVAGSTSTTVPVATTSSTSTTVALIGTVSQRNAVAKAASYLRSSAFSRIGLIEQLEYEGFSREDATYGVDARNVDWMAQAVKKGASYLRSSAFSRSGLIAQLEYEGFTAAEAQFGTDSQNADWNQQAAKKAASYLRSSSFSRSGLIGQLEYEGFTRAQAEFGVNSVGL